MRRQGGSKLDTDKSSSPHMMGNKHINTGPGETQNHKLGLQYLSGTLKTVQLVMQSSLNPLCLLLGHALLLNHDLRSSVCYSHNDPSFGRANGDIFFSMKKEAADERARTLPHVSA